MTKELINHDSNGPFVRSYNASTTGQTETVYAVRVRYVNGAEEFWDPQAEPHSDERVNQIRDMAYRDPRKRQVVSVEAVSRSITILATGWIAGRGEPA